ncbi:hypothetical protein PHJA_001023500 [Phtheirospermum japonicum]|uniref:Uncharacterized protein n=1 Tax=Phtheirospermum japonicum TaxID=374723 RepID=A0A830BV16_9LAMI|nr:hypothetical protein PHJA_001023500 [Phtheirospermum japonicum]
MFEVFTGQQELLARIGVSADEVARAGDSLALTDLSLKFIAPLRSGDRFVLRVRVNDSSAVRKFFEHFIYKLPTLEPFLEAKGTAVWLDKNYRPVRIPADVRSKLTQFIRARVGSFIVRAKINVCLRHVNIFRTLRSHLNSIIN